jgi:lysophospholipase L1-like esterase
MWTPLLRSLQSAFARARAAYTPAASPGRRLALEYLEDRTVPSGVTTIATMGDSLTAPYPSWAPWGAAGDQSWAQQLAAQGNKHLAIDNVAVPGTTSSQLLTGGQVSTVAHLVSTGAVHYATLIVGANDVVFDYLQTIVQGNPAPFVQAVTGNIEAALTTVAAAGDVKLAVGNIPDVGLTPSMRYELAQVLGVPASQLPAVLQNVTTATTQANDEIEAFAAGHGIPVIDLFGMGQVIAAAPASPVSVGGVKVSNLYAPDYFHPNTVAQGLLADAILEALGDTYNPRLERFRLTD